MSSKGTYKRVAIDRRFRGPGIATRNKIIGQYRYAAKERGLVWGLSTEDFTVLSQQNCHYCGAPPVERSYTKLDSSTAKYNGGWVCNGIDRRDNDLGYTPQNCLPCCTICNYAKSKMGYAEFIQYLQRVAEFQRGRGVSNGTGTDTGTIEAA